MKSSTRKQVMVYNKELCGIIAKCPLGTPSLTLKYLWKLNSLMLKACLGGKKILTVVTNQFLHHWPPFFARYTLRCIVLQYRQFQTFLGLNRLLFLQRERILWSPTFPVKEYLILIFLCRRQLRLCCSPIM